MEEETRTEYDAAFAAGAASVLLKLELQDLGGTPFALVRPDTEIENLEKLLPRPLRRRAKARFTSPEHFGLYVNRFKLPSTTLVADQDSGTVTALVDYHEGGPSGAASWVDHHATLKLNASPEWQTWMSKNGKQMTQIDFAEFLEQNIPDIVEPDGAIVLEAATHLEARRTVAFRKAINLTNGMTQLLYDEAEEGKGKGEIKIPTRFTVALAVYEHTERVTLAARLRYRISDQGALTFTYLLDRPHKAVEKAFADVLEEVAATTEIPPLMGSIAAN